MVREACPGEGRRRTIHDLAACSREVVDGGPPAFAGAGFAAMTC
jgi:hypothetical protein